VSLKRGVRSSTSLGRGDRSGSQGDAEESAACARLPPRGERA
jgi:hypothetical protein